MSSAPRQPGYPPRFPGTWWLDNRRYFLYMVRELTAVFAALWMALFLFRLPQLTSGPQAFADWVTFIRSPGWLVFSVVSLAFVLYHAWTAFTATGALVFLRFGPKPVAATLLNTTMLVGWGVVSLVIGVLVLTPVSGS